MRAFALALVAGVLCALTPAPPSAAQTGEPLRDEGARLYDEGCSSCHGPDLRGIPGRAPNLRGVGAASADFYLRTGRMPLAEPGDQPVRSEPPFSDRQIRALVEYVAGFGGPAIPEVEPSEGDVAEGRELFTDSCAGCHQVLARGGIPTEGVAPDLLESEPVDVAEALQIGPYTMPHFRGRFTDEEVASLARYIDHVKNPDDRGGWGIGHIGPVPEGMVAWFLAGGALLLTIRLIGERMRS